MSKNMAFVNSNKVVENIIVANDDIDESENLIEYFESNPAFIGGDFDNGFFYPPKPHESWSKDGKGNWTPPSPMPSDGKYYYWSEDDMAWLELPAG